MSSYYLLLKLHLLITFFRIGTSENGWTDDEIGFEWFKEVFVPQATERNRRATEQERADEQRQATASDAEPLADHENAAADDGLKLPPILLIYDGHGSHTTLDWITLARANNIILYCLPPHTTHRLQPLDVGCFGPLQIAWFNRCDEILDETGEPMEMKEVVREYFEARRKAFKSENIFQAWKKSGLCPLNADLFTASDFAPSHSSSTVCHAPQSFPSRMPHVPDASSDDDTFDPAQFQHLVPVDRDDSPANPMEVSSDSESDTSSNSDFGVGQSTSSDLSDSESDDLEVRERRSLQEDDIHSEIGVSVGEEDNTPPVKYPRARLSIYFESLPRFSTSTSPRHYTRSQHKHDQVLLSHIPPSLLGTPGPQFDDSDRDLQVVIRKLRKELEYTRAQRDSAETYAVQSQHECAVWKHHFNKKQEKSRKETSRRVHTRARFVTNDLGIEEAQQDHEKRVEKKQKEAAKLAQKAAKQKEDLVRRATQGSTRTFVGSLSLTKNKTELEDIADAVGIDISGTKVQLLERITNHFNNHPCFKEDARFCGMFDRVRGRKRTAPDDENHDAATAPGPARHRRCLSSYFVHLDTVTNTYESSHLPPAAPHHFSLLSFPVASSSQVTVEDLQVLGAN